MKWFRLDALGTVILVISSLFLLSFAILAFISPSHFQTQRAQVFVILTILVAVSGISLILSGTASKKKNDNDSSSLNTSIKQDEVNTWVEFLGIPLKEYCEVH